MTSGRKGSFWVVSLGCSPWWLGSHGSRSEVSDHVTYIIKKQRDKIWVPRLLSFCPFSLSVTLGPRNVGWTVPFELTQSRNSFSYIPRKLSFTQVILDPVKLIVITFVHIQGIYVYKNLTLIEFTLPNGEWGVLILSSIINQPSLRALK